MDAIRSTLKGGLLIAVPRLRDPNFARMVVLMVHHDADGAFGVVLGPPAPATISDLCGPLGITWSRKDSPRVRYGGPCEPSRIWILHGGDVPLTESEHTIVPGLHLGSSLPLLERISLSPEIPIAVMSGYAGWGPGQLESEMAQNSWLPGEVTPELVFETRPEEVWEASLRAMNLTPEMIISGFGATA